jgi:hypothetical protein
MDGFYQRKLSPETEIVFDVSDGQIIRSPTTTIGQVENERNISVQLVLKPAITP